MVYPFTLNSDYQDVKYRMYNQEKEGRNLRGLYHSKK